MYFLFQGSSNLKRQDWMDNYELKEFTRISTWRWPQKGKFMPSHLLQIVEPFGLKQSLVLDKPITPYSPSITLIMDTTSALKKVESQKVAQKLRAHTHRKRFPSYLE